MVGVVRRSLVHIAAIFCHSEGGEWRLLRDLLYFIVLTHAIMHMYTHTQHLPCFSRCLTSLLHPLRKVSGSRIRC